VSALRWGAVLLVLAAAACSDDDGDAAPPTSTTASTAPTPTFTGDGSAFCTAMLALGQVAGADGATPADVVAANQQLVAQLDEAQANTPEDAPPDLGSLLDDYRIASEAIGAAKGDVEAAFEALGVEHPDVVARLGSSSSHEEAYSFLVERCGINAP
jgi:hypothetical protein